MKRRTALLAALLFPLVAFSQETPKTNPTAPAEKSATAPKVRFKTNQGEIVIELDAKKAPVTVKNFLSYVDKKHYDGTIFHRVIEDFMIQGGGFELKDGKTVEKPTGKGIVNESKNGLKNDRGTIAMARTSDPNSASAQFFINVNDNAALNFPSNGGYAVFGKVVKGMDVVDKIVAVEKKMGMDGTRSMPVAPVIIESATAE